MKTQICIVKLGVDHIELQVGNESAAEIVADEAHKADIKPVFGQRHECKMTSQHYVVLHGVARDVLRFLNQNPSFDLIAS